MMLRARVVVAFAVVWLLPSIAFAEFAFVSGGSASAGTDPAGIVIADLNQDGRPDVLAGNDSVATVSAILSSGAGQYLPPVSYFTGWQGRFFHRSQTLEFFYKNLFFSYNAICRSSCPCRVDSQLRSQSLRP